MSKKKAPRIPRPSSRSPSPTSIAPSNGVGPTERINGLPPIQTMSLEQKKDVVRADSYFTVLRGLLANEDTSTREDFYRYFHQYGGNKDIDGECGYPRFITFEMYKNMFEREGIASRVVSVMPSLCWSVPPCIYYTEYVYEEELKDPLQLAWDTLVKNYQILTKLECLDIISGIGEYGCMLVGIGGAGDLDQPLPCLDENGEWRDFNGNLELLYLMPFDEGDAKVLEWNTDTQSKRYGKPQYYDINLASPEAKTFKGVKNTKIHWSRVIHVPSDSLTNSNGVAGPPRQKKVYNYLINIRKILGGSAEMFWQGGFPGTMFYVPPEIVDQVELGQEEKDAIKKDAEDFFRGFKRWMSMKGLMPQQMNPNIADPDTHIDVQLLAISISIDVPQRVLMGTEEARLASVQDNQNLNKKITKRHNVHCTPSILQPLVHLFMAAKWLPRYEEFFCTWPDIFSVSETDRADITGKLVRALGEYVSTGAFKLFPPMEFFTIIMDLTPERAMAVIDAAIAALDDPDLQAITEFTPPGMDQELAMREKELQMKAKTGSNGKATVNEEDPEFVVNPMMRCTSGGKPGFKWGNSGKCYTYSPGDKASIGRAKKKVMKQAKAIEMHKRMNALMELRRTVQEEMTGDV